MQARKTNWLILSIHYSFLYEEIESDDVVSHLLSFIRREVDSDNVVYPIMPFNSQEEKCTP